MDKYRIIEITQIDKENGFTLGQIVEGEIKKEKRLPPYEGTLEILDVKDSEWFIKANQVEKV